MTGEWTPAMVEARLEEAVSAGLGRRFHARAGEVWLSWLDPVDAGILRARAEGSPWKVICWRFGIGRATAHRRWQYGVSLIAWRLNGRQLPVKRSRRRFIELARASSRK